MNRLALRSSPPTQSTLPLRLLLIEDDALLLRSLAASLREEGYAVDTAADGTTGAYLAESHAYDAIILDILLPGLDGWSVLNRLRPSVRIPILMLTALDAAGDRVKGLDRGADDYLPKPFVLDELLARLRAVIRRSAGQTRSIIDFDSFQLDLATRSVRRFGSVVSLTAREYTLLEYLTVHRGRVVTRSELYEHLFDETDDSMSNLLDVHVSNLRKKLGPTVVHTRRGHGYLIP